MTEPDALSFKDLGLHPSVLRALEEADYEQPTPIQANTIPMLLSGRDLLGQAQTGTGKTAAFSLPALTRIDFSQKRSGPAMLVLVPTRELAMQVAEAIKTYGRYVTGVNVVSVYGGASYVPQLRALKSGVGVVVGTPGRVMDHMRRGTLDLSEIELLVLDEADEMLKMGFAEDVEWIVEHAPSERQIALFSATMPAPIKRIATRYLRDAEHVVSKHSAKSAETIDQFAVVCPQREKVDVLAQLLSVETTDGVLVFVRTRAATTEIAKALEERGYQAAALSGELNQPQREQLVRRLKGGRLNILVATDVAARGLDVKRVSHVINFDLPPDAETYVHRIGRTGRAGRAGRAILFVTPRAKGRLNGLERSTKQKIELYRFPSVEDFASMRREAVAQEVEQMLEADSFEDYETWLRELCNARDLDPVRVAAAAVFAARNKQPLVPPYRVAPSPPERSDKKSKKKESFDNKSGRGQDRQSRSLAAGRGPRKAQASDEGMESYRVEVGRKHGAEPKHLVGAIANEAGLRGKDIGRIELYDDHSIVDLPEGMPQQVLRALKRTWVLEQPLRMRKLGSPKAFKKVGKFKKKAKSKSKPGEKRKSDEKKSGKKPGKKKRKSKDKAT